MRGIEGDEWDPFFDRPMDLSFTHHATQYSHLPYSYCKDKIPGVDLEKAIKFVVIRDPIDRLKSYYHFSIKQEWLKLSIEEWFPMIYESIKSILERGYARNYTAIISQNKRQNACGFDFDYDDFDTYVNGVPEHGLMDTFSVMRQTDFFNDQFTVLRFEHLQEDFNNFTKHYNLPNIILPQHNVSSHNSAYDYLSTIDPEEFWDRFTYDQPKQMIDTILDYYKEDFNMKGVYRLC